MKEYILLIRNTMDSKADFSPQKHMEFVNKCSVYIEGLQRAGKLLAAQPMVREGVLLSKNADEWETAPFNEQNEIMVGYYHIIANDMAEAIEIAKGNPEFAYTTTARIEVRPLKIKEESTGYVYPNND
jgi:hypothetical protein